MLAIAHATGETDAVEELKNLDCALAAAADAVTKVGGTDAAILACSEFDGKRAHLRHRGARIEQVAHNLERLAAQGDAAQQAAHLCFAQRAGGGAGRLQR